MAEFPSLIVFTDAILADCSYMDDERFGAYHRLIYLIWRSPECRIPNDDSWLADKLNRPIENIKTVYRKVIKDHCKNDGNWITQTRLKKEKKFRRDNSKKKSDAAKALWEKKKSYTGALVGSNDVHMPPYPTQPTPNLTLPKEGLINNPIPVLNPAREEGEIKINGFGKVRLGEGRTFFPTEKTVQEIISIAPQWNLQTLLEHYKEFSRDKDKPTYPQAAFKKWAENFTKGKPPR